MSFFSVSKLLSKRINTVESYENISSVLSYTSVDGQ